MLPAEQSVTRRQSQPRAAPLRRSRPGVYPASGWCLHPACECLLAACRSRVLLGGTAVRGVEASGVRWWWGGAAREASGGSGDGAWWKW